MGTFSGTASFALVGSYTKASDLSTLTEAVNYSNSPTGYTNGSGANQVNAFYSDTRTAGTDVIVNGTFAADTDWTKGTGWTIAAGVATKSSSAAASDLSQTVAPLVNGKTYRVVFTISGYSGTGTIKAVLGTQAGSLRSANGTYTEDIVANGTGFKFTATGADTAAFLGSIDNATTRVIDSFDLDLASGEGSIVDSYGAQLVFTKIKQLFIRNRSVVTLENLLVSGDFLGSALVVGSEHLWKIGPGGSRLIDDPIDGMAVTAGTGDVLTVNAGAFAIAYDIIILGTVA